MHSAQQRTGSRNLAVLPYLEAGRNLTWEKTENIHSVGLPKILRSTTEFLLLENLQEIGNKS